RPFTMADKAYDFTRMFNENESVDELAWQIWGMQTVLGLLEANVKHNVKFATDDRATYSLMQLIIAYKELEHFGTFDYVHTTLEFLRPWMGSEGEATEFLSLFQESVEGGYVDQAIESMDAAIFVRNVAERIESVSDSMITASSYLDSETVTEDGGGFNTPEVAGVPLSGEGTVQHLKRAKDTKKLTAVLKAIESTNKDVRRVKEVVTDDTVDSLSVQAQLAPLRTEWSEVRSEWTKAKSDFSRSRGEIKSARDGYSSLSIYIDGEVCTNPIAAMLWFGDSEQDVKGFREILPAKVNETDALVEYYRDLEVAINALEYIDDEYQIDAHYNNVKEALERAEANLQEARAAREKYFDQKYNHDNCYRHVDWKDPKMRGCLGQGYACKPYDCNPYKCNPVTETDEEGNSVTSWDTCWKTCYRTCYDCICDKDVLMASYQRADTEYREQMRLAGQNLDTAASEVSTLQIQIEAFFSDRGLAQFYRMINDTHGMYDEPTNRPLERAARPYSISDSYYSHWNYSSCSDDRKYNCAKMLVPVPSLPINSANYASNMPKSPLTYDAAHRGYGDYGLYYIKYVIDRMDETFSDKSIDAEAMKDGKDTLEEMKSNGFFETLLAILKPVNKLMDTAGDVKSAIAKIKHADEAFPHINEHFYTTLPLPPFNGSKIGFEDQGFTVIHDIRLRADTRPGTITLPIIGPVTLGKDPGVNPALPIPWTPISVYLWEFEIGPSKVGTEKDGDSEPSTLWLIDTENVQIAPLMEMKIDSGGTVPVPLYLHKPIMYKYEFTPEKSIRKGLNDLPPVFVLSLGPFMTRFRSHMEPPDKAVTDSPLAINVSFDREFANDSAVLTVSTPEEGIRIRKYITEVVNGNSSSLPNDKNEISTNDLALLGEYGWSEVRADAYATDLDSDFDIANIKGEDHARVYFIDASLTSVGVRLEENDGSLNIENTGNKRVDVSVNPESVETCMFIFYEGNMSKNWIGSINPNKSVNLNVSVMDGTKIVAKVLIPEKIEEELERRGIQLKTKHYFSK
ncbi:MAG: hypothetical protein V3R93_07300, partial [Candidatus Hydrothermarchaeaceae archaeon]